MPGRGGSHGLSHDPAKERIGVALTCGLAGEIGGHGRQCAGASPPPTSKQFIPAVVTWDLNNNGDVTCEEWRAYVAGLFHEADANHDGTLTREEFAVMSRRDRLFETAGFNYFEPAATAA